MRITGEELRSNLEKDPDWCLGKKCVVTTFADLSNSPIRTLSPNMEFIGRNEQGDVVRLWGCKDLHTLEGIFHGGIEAGADGMMELDSPDENGDIFKKITTSPNGICRVENCQVTSPNKKGYAADFGGSESLQKLSGKFHGAVLVGGEHQNKTVLSIKDLEITGTNEEGTSLISIWTKFEKLEGKFSGGVSAYFSEFEECGKPNELEIKKADKNGFKLTAYPNSPFKELPKPEDYPFKSGEVTITGADETGDSIQEHDQQALDDLAMLKEQIEAFQAREAQRIKNRPWTETAKREMVRSIAERLKLDDMLKQEDIPSSDKKRFGLLKLCPIVLTVALITASTLGKDIVDKVKDKIIVEPAATSLVDQGRKLVAREWETTTEKSIPTRYLGPVLKYLQSEQGPENLRTLHKETSLADQLLPKALEERLELERKISLLTGVKGLEINLDTIREKVIAEFEGSENPWVTQYNNELKALQKIYQNANGVPKAAPTNPSSNIVPPKEPTLQSKSEKDKSHAKSPEPWLG